ncbi:LysR substrate-binding domain-containing protein [Arhodomonas aquaeolei]|uniref:LysR substrate-binding domain-containing protein n=1 Tax=Arhodomonas aquaeolei TaxID=2369 RepID=UPI002168EC2A|nr:LysR substrate-binding domain-containing protein [Arhodomonas aquaeolei]MCS4504344.1 LysR substrate-binding domain-containing protein [Arhodomonas aquaeolei]
MDTDLLRAFIAVAESGGFSAAGKGLNRTQSAVSLQIKRLEERVGEALFERTSRSVRLTEAGGTFLPYARRILRLQEEAVGAVGEGAEASQLRFGLSEEQALAYLPEVLAGFTRAHPDLHLEVICEMSPVLIRRLEEGELDLALAVRHRHTKTGEVVAREPLVWVAAEGFVPPVGAPLPMAVNPEGCTYRAQAFSALSRAGWDWRVVYTSQSPTGINLAVQAGLAVTVKTPRSVPEGCRILDTRHGLPALPHVDIELHRAPGVLPAATDAFVDALMGSIAHTEGVETVTAPTAPAR